MISCLRSRALLALSLGPGAAESQLIDLEEHLERCEPCRDERGRLLVLRSLGTEPVAALDEEAHARILARLREAPHENAPALSKRFRFPAPLAWSMVGALSAAAALALAWPRSPPPPPPKPSVPVTFARGTELSMPQPGALSFDGARVAYRAGTRLVLGRRRTLALVQGALDVEVKPGGEERFRVTTPRFAVEVLGTHFLVTLADVRTLSGTARVLDLNDRPLAVVRAGEVWSLPAGPASPAAQPAVVPTPTALPSARAPARLRPSATRLLAAARLELAKGDIAAARWTLARLDRAHPTRHQKASGALLLADALRLEGRRLEAVAAYREVAQDYARLPAGENAAFLAAEVLSENGEATQARAALERYLATYPAGRFAVEARRRLQLLAP